MASASPSAGLVRAAQNLVRLGEVIANHRWLLADDPFPHFFARDVFVDATVGQLTEAYSAILARGLGERFEPDRFSRISGYDAYAYPFTPSLPPPLSLFTSRAWHDLIARVAGVNATGDVRGGLHHHKPGSDNGLVHNDLNPGYFAGTPRPDRIVLPDPDKCSYHYGTVSVDGVRPRQTVRAVAIIYYLNNPPWTEGDGGETGLYRASGTIEDPARRVPPLNNAMLVFECTPVSWHTFISNRRHPRNSVIMWLHRPYSDAVSRWGENKIAKW